MHLSEFQAWFEGFTEEMKAPPNKDQWVKIKKRVKEITSDYTPPTVFIDRHYYPWRRYWDYTPTWTSTGSTTGVGISSSSSCVLNAANAANVSLTAKDWSAAGRAEYLAGQ